MGKNTRTKAVLSPIMPSQWDERLARHYGIEGVEGEEFRRVSLAGTPRGGVFTQASVLTATSNPTRTSPVKRGRWVLEVLLGTPPPPPLPDAPSLASPTDSPATLREQLELHRADARCAVCHHATEDSYYAAWHGQCEGTILPNTGNHWELTTRYVVECRCECREKEGE